MEEQLKLVAYIIYLPLALLMTVSVAHKLFQNSKIFMLDIFHGRESIAYSTNNLFKIGFYLLNIGAALFLLKIGAFISTEVQLMEQVSTKVGTFAFYLGIMLFLNLFLFFRGKKKARMKKPQMKKTPQTIQP